MPPQPTPRSSQSADAEPTHVFPSSVTPSDQEVPTLQVEYDPERFPSLDAHFQQFFQSFCARENLRADIRLRDDASTGDKPGAPPPAAVAPPAPGLGISVAARYRVIEELGRGGMGIVFEAHDQVLRRPIALKVPAPAIVSAPRARERFLREARIAAGLRHPNIITIYDAGEIEGGLYIAMELIEGLTLAAHLHARGPLPPGQFLALARQMCAGLSHAHARSIVHADVKPANMIVDAAGTVHITDFGLARAWEGADSATLEARGTPSYISPEQVRCEALDARTDVYGLGCTLYHMAAGAPPFTRGEVLYRHLHEAPPGFRERNPDAPEALEQVILRCLAKRPEDRFPSMDSLWAALEATLPSDPSARPDGGPGAPAPPR